MKPGDVSVVTYPFHGVRHVVRPQIGERDALGLVAAHHVPPLCPCGGRAATIGGYCDECRADARDPGEP